MQICQPTCRTPDLPLIPPDGAPPPPRTHLLLVTSPITSQLRRFVGAWPCLYHQCSQPPQLVLDITLCGDWAGVPSVYNATCSGGTTGICVRILLLSVNAGLRPHMCSTTITSSAQVVPAMTMPISRSITFGCTPSIHSLRLFQVLCTVPALAAPPNRRAPALDPTLNQTPVSYSIPRHLSTCSFCCSSAHLPLSSKVVDRRSRTSRTHPQTFFRTLHNLYTHLLTIRTSFVFIHEHFNDCSYRLAGTPIRDPEDELALPESKYPISPPTQTHDILPAMSTSSQPLSDIIPVVADATVLSTEARITLTRLT